MIELSRHWPFQPQRIQYPNDELFGPGALIWTGSTPNVVTQSGVIRSAALPQYKGRGFGKLGVSGAWNAASGDGLRFPNWRPDITSAMTCFVVAAPVSGSSSAETAFALSSDAGSFGRYPSVTFQFNVNPYGSLGYSGHVTLACANTSSEFACWGYDGGIDGALHCWSCSIDTTDSYMLRDGVDITYPGAGQPYSGTMTRPEQQFFIGAHPSFDGARPMTSPLYMVAIVPRKMAKAEAARISQLLLRNLGVGFSKRPKRVFVSAGGAGSYSLTADSGSYALTGQSVGLLASRTLAAGQGSYALTGQDVALLRLYTLTAAQGSYSLSGQAVALTVSRLLAAGQGSYALTGQAVGLLASRVLAAGQGSYALTGQAVGLVYTPLGSYSLIADAGSYSLTGQAVGLLASRVLAAEAGSYGLSGQDVGLVYTPAGAIYTLTAEAGSYAITGQDISFARTYVLTAAAGSYTLTGRDVTLSYSGAPPVSVPDMVRTARGVARLAIHGTTRNVIRGYRP